MRRMASWFFYPLRAWWLLVLYTLLLECENFEQNTTHGAPEFHTITSEKANAALGRSPAFLEPQNPSQERTTCCWRLLGERDTAVSQWQTSRLHRKATQAVFNSLKTAQACTMTQRHLFHSLLPRVIGGLLNGPSRGDASCFIRSGSRNPGAQMRADIYSSAEVFWLGLLSLPPLQGGRMGSTQTSSDEADTPSQLHCVYL